MIVWTFIFFACTNIYLYFHVNTVFHYNALLLYRRFVIAALEIFVGFHIQGIKNLGKFNVSFIFIEYCCSSGQQTSFFCALPITHSNVYHQSWPTFKIT